MSQYGWLVEAFRTETFTAFDTETTGLEPFTERVVEAGGIRFDSRGIIARFNALIDPKIPMPPKASSINGITDAMLKGQPDAAAVMPDFLRFLGSSILLAHNAQFDVKFINSELARLALPSLGNRVIDTVLLARDVFPGLPNYKLQDLAKRVGIEAIDAHRAEDDARVCMELFLVCLRELEGRAPNSGTPPLATLEQSGDGGTRAVPSREDDLFADEDGYDDDDYLEENPE